MTISPATNVQSISPIDMTDFSPILIVVLVNSQYCSSDLQRKLTYAFFTLSFFPNLLNPASERKGVYRNKSRGGKICAKRKIFFCPPLGASRGGQNSNCKVITLGFLDIRHKYKILKRHTYSPNNYLLSTTLSLLQTKLAEKNIVFIILFTFYYTFIGIFSI